MKRRNVFRLVAALFAAVFLLLPLTAGGTVRVEAASYGYEIDRYTVEMELFSDRTVEVKEVIACNFGSGMHGIIRDLPLDSGLRYRNIRATCDHADFSPYTQTDDVSFLSLYLGGKNYVEGSRVYTLTYTMALPALSDRNYVTLDVVGYGWENPLNNVEVKVTVPSVLSDQKFYTGSYGTHAGADFEKNGSTFTFSADRLERKQGVTCDFEFEEGVLTQSFDPSILIALGLAVLLVLSALAVKYFFCRGPIVTATVNLEAPESMDPLLMGKYIDNCVDGEDLGALIFWLADQGYLEIDMSEGESDPLLLSTGKPFDENIPGYIRVFYDGLFSGRDRVRESELRNKFYRTASSVTAGVGLKAGKLYESKSNILLGVFGALAVLLLGGFAYLYHTVTVFGGYRYFSGFLACLISFVISAAGSRVARQREKKWKRGWATLFTVGAAALALAAVLIFAIVPSPAFGLWTGVILCAGASASGGIAGRFLIWTKDYAAKLGQILGFKQFILFTERDKIEFMLKERPELYYHILPYAQVLGVTDAWTDKFKGLEMKPPVYISGRVDLFDVILFDHMFRSVSGHIARTFVSRPSSSGKGFNGGGGGFSGGFGGGGFGGGGGRGF